MESFYIINNPNSSNTIEIKDTSIFQISTQLYDSNYYDLVFGVCNVFGSNEFTLHVTDYEQTKPTILNSAITFELSNVNIHYNINLNIDSNSLLQNYEIQSHMYDGIQLENNILSIYHCNLERTCNITIAVSNVWDSNTFTITIYEWMHAKPKLIDNDNAVLLLSNQVFQFDYTNYFTGLMQGFYIVDNPNSSNTIELTDTIYSISTDLLAYSNYDLVFGVSNVFGSNQFTLHVTDYEQAAPMVVNSTITFELSNVNIHYNIDSNVYSNSLLQYYEIQSELYDGIVLDNNIISIYHSNVERTCNITIAVGNVWDSNIFTITIHEWEHVAPKYIDDYFDH